MTTSPLNKSLLYELAGEARLAASRRALPARLIADLVKSARRTEQIVGLADRLIRVAESALDLQQTAVVEQVSQTLLRMPLPRHYQSLGEYYRVFALRRRGALAEAGAGFERLAEAPTLPLQFRARAIQALALSHTEQGRWDDGRYGFLQAIQAARAGADLFTQVSARWMMAVRYTSRDGDHAGALKVYDELMPFIRLLAFDRPHLYYCMLNSRALELIELGHGDEALRLASVAVNSPLSKLHPEFRETQAEILEKMRRASPSVIGGIGLPQEPLEANAAPVAASPVAASNVIALPLAARRVVESPGAAPRQPARVIAYSGWQQQAADSADNSQESFTPAELRQLSICDKQKALLTVIFHDDVTHDTLDRLLGCAGKIVPDQTVG